MKRRPPRSTRPHTLFPYPTPFRSHVTKAAPPVVRLRASWPRATGSAHRPAIDTRALSHPSSRHGRGPPPLCRPHFLLVAGPFRHPRSEEHTSELQSLMRISYAVFCLKKKNIYTSYNTNNHTS